MVALLCMRCADKTTRQATIGALPRKHKARVAARSTAASSSTSFRPGRPCVARGADGGGPVQLQLGQVVRHHSVGMAMPQTVLGFEQSEPFHVFEMACTAQHAEPVFDRLTILFFDPREIRRKALYFVCICHIQKAQVKRIATSSE